MPADHEPSEGSARSAGPRGAAEQGLVTDAPATGMGRSEPQADQREPAGAGSDVLGPPAPPGGAPRPGPAAPEEDTAEPLAEDPLPRTGQQLSAGEG